ncbi:hypothetical protein PybrP1_006428 [[Pythium] brassicae (nom. inval.)]|nr:hypothetical protein PybrP1_006428 [[Pythium] brassicae (nom. inval.)]
MLVFPDPFNSCFQLLASAGGGKMSTTSDLTEENSTRIACARHSVMRNLLLTVCELWGFLSNVSSTHCSEPLPSLQPSCPGHTLRHIISQSEIDLQEASAQFRCQPTTWSPAPRTRSGWWVCVCRPDSRAPDTVTPPPESLAERCL